MSPKKFFVNNGKENVGPFDFNQIFEKVKVGQLKTSDRVYNDEEDQWVAIQHHPEFVKLNLQTSTPFKMDLPAIPQVDTPPPKPKLAREHDAVTPVTGVTSVTGAGNTNSEKPFPSKTDAGIGEWYILMDGSRHGPFSFYEMIKLLQEKKAFEYDYAWRHGLENWTRIAEISDFTPDNMRRLAKSNLTKGQDIFFRRKNPRLNYECAIIAHDNKNFWSGYTLELSEEGAGIVLENAMIMPGQRIYLHFKAGPQTKPFNVLCEVVSKKYIRNVKTRNTPMIYGIMFVNIPKQEKDLIKSLSA